MSLVSNVIDVVKRNFISGMLVVVPLILTYLVLRFLLEGIDGILQPVLYRAFGYFVPGLGIVTTLLLILLAGLLTRNIIGRQLYRYTDRILARVPLIRPIYLSAKQLLESMTRSSEKSLKEVALIEYPRKGIYQLGFVSQRFDVKHQGETKRFASVFIGTTPAPVSGWAVIVPEDELMLLHMTVEEGIKFLVSGGVVSPTLMESRGADIRPASGENSS